MRVLVTILLVLTASKGMAEAPETSLRPVARAATKPVAEVRAQAETRVRKGLFKSLRPLLRSREVRRQAREQERLAKRGAVCGDIAIQGVAIGPVSGKIGGCGVENAVKVRSVSGVALSQQAVMDCTTAKTLKSWIEKGMQPAVGNRGGGRGRACGWRRITRAGRAITGKVRGFRNMARGGRSTFRALSCATAARYRCCKHWGRGRNGRILKTMHRNACGWFGTVLGPGSDGHHRDHFPFRYGAVSQRVLLSLICWRIRFRRNEGWSGLA